MENTYIKSNEGEKSFNLIDILRYLLSHWKWFLLSIVIGVSYNMYRYYKSPFIYSKSETVMIKTPMNTPTTTTFTSSNVGLNSVNVASEILQLKSKDLMQKTVLQIAADVSYTVRKGLRDQELYKDAPVEVKFLDSIPEKQVSFQLEVLDGKQVLIKNLDGSDDGAEIRVPLDKIVKTPFGNLLIKARDGIYESFRHSTIKVTKHPLNTIVYYYLGQLQVKQLEEDASLVEISMHDYSPRRASDLISTLIVVYNQVSASDKNQLTFNTAMFIQERLSVMGRELGAAEEDTERLKTTNQGIDVNTAGQLYLSDGRQYQAERKKIETDIKLVGMMREYLTDKSKQNDLIPNNTGLVDVDVENQVVEYNKVLLKRNRLVENGNSSNPIVEDLDKTLFAIRNNIDQAVDNTIAGLQVKMKNVQRNESQAMGKVIQIPQKQRLTLSLEREQKVKEDLYVFLLNKREENALKQAMTEDNIRIIEHASGSNNPIQPVYMLKLLTGICFGLALPFIVLIFGLFLDTSVKTRKDIEERIHVPFLAEIPFSKKSKSDSEGIQVSTFGRDPLTEAFRILRTNISFMSRNAQAPKVITFTSFRPGEGKTFCVLNLAATLTQLEKKVIVVDMDLRKGTLSNRTKVEGSIGLTHYLSSDKYAVQDIIYPMGDNDKLDIITIGAVAPNPVELLLSSRLELLIEELQATYDYILIDCVPVGIVADISIVDRVSNLTLFVIRANKTDKRELPELNHLYNVGKLTNMAILLNGVNLQSKSYGYGNSYGYGYGYGYGIDKPNWKSSFMKFIGRAKV